MDNRNKENTKVIVINDELIMEEGFAPLYSDASSAHLEMLKMITSRLQENGLARDYQEQSNIYDAGLLVAKLINGLVVQVFPNGEETSEVLLALYSDEVGLNEKTVINFKTVYDSLLNSKNENGYLKIKGALFVSSENTYPKGVSEDEDTLSFENIISDLPLKNHQERK